MISRSAYFSLVIGSEFITLTVTFLEPFVRRCCQMIFFWSLLMTWTISMGRRWPATGGGSRAGHRRPRARDHDAGFIVLGCRPRRSRAGQNSGWHGWARHGCRHASGTRVFRTGAAGASRYYCSRHGKRALTITLAPTVRMSRPPWNFGGGPL
jgi:hypothetical protein